VNIFFQFMNTNRHSRDCKAQKSTKR